MKNILIGSLISVTMASSAFAAELDLLICGGERQSYADSTNSTGYLAALAVDTTELTLKGEVKIFDLQQGKVKSRAEATISSVIKDIQIQHDNAGKGSRITFDVTKNYKDVSNFLSKSYSKIELLRVSENPEIYWLIADSYFFGNSCRLNMEVLKQVQSSLKAK